MSDHSDRPTARERRLTTDDALEETIAALLERASNPRQVWLLFLDEDDRLAPLIMPCDDLPLDPDEPTRTADLGTCSAAGLLANRLQHIIDDCGFAQAVIVWERIGPPQFAPTDRAWARALAVGCASIGARLRAQFVLHTDGIRPITPDDYAAP